MSVAGARILLVEDELPLLQLLERYLQRAGFEIQTYSDSVEALRHFESNASRYDLVIADLGMPEMMMEAIEGLLARRNSGPE